MYSEMSTIKIKSKTGQSIASHLNTYQGESIRKSICQDLKVIFHPFSMKKVPRGCLPSKAKSVWVLAMI